jgi:diguanylate cyclase (GGDEF)-like protein
MLETLELKRILYVILSGITAGDGLRFNRAFLFLVDEGRRSLHGQMAIGPRDPTEAHRIWEAMEQQRFDLETLMKRYEVYRSDDRAAALSREISRLAFPLPLPEPANTPSESFVDLLEAVFARGLTVLRNNQEVVIENTGVTLSHFLMVPLRSGEVASGVLVCDNAYNRRRVAPQEVDDVLSLANLAAIAVERARLHERIRRMAERDGLTGLANRRLFDTLFKKKFDEAKQRQTPLSMVFVDMDKFKDINDTHGHLAGDDLLREVAAIIRSRIRRGDVAARYGGDEMVLVLPGATAAQAARVAEHIRATVADTHFGKEPVFRASVSLGVASLRAEHQVPSDLLAETDRAVYAAKNNGRNRVVVSPRNEP